MPRVAKFRAAATPLLRQFLATSGWRAGMLVGLNVGIGILQGAGILMALPLLTVIGLGDSNAPAPPIAREILAALEGLGISFTLGVALCLYLIVAGLNAGARYGAALLESSVTRDFVLRLQHADFARVLHLSWLRLASHSKGAMLNEQTRDVAIAGNAAQTGLRFIGTMILSLAYVGAACLISAPVALISLGCGLVGVVLLYPIHRRILKLSSAVREDNQTVFERLTELFAAMKLIKCFGREKSSLADYEADTRTLAANQYRSRKWQALAPGLHSCFGALAICLFVFIALVKFDLDSGRLLVLLLIMSRILPLANHIQSAWQNLLNAWPSIEALSDRLRAAGSPTKPADPTIPLPLAKSLELREIEFAYPNRAPVLTGFNLTVPAKSITALAGPSGAGKSTLADLILGLLEPRSGQLLVDGKVLNDEDLPAWRTSTAYLPQDNFLFSTTIRENLRWIDPEVSDERIWEVLELASAADFVRQLPDGLDTQVGERGAQISGGERQRIALARALLANPQLLVLDEPTSALDAENEAAVRDALIRLKGRMAILIIAHRGALIETADQVVELKRASNDRARR